MRVFVAGHPRPQGSKRHIGRGRMVESSPHIADWRKTIATVAGTTARASGLRPSPAEVSVMVSVRFVFNRPKAHYRTGQNAHLLRDAAPRHPMGKACGGDVDKLARGVLDALAGIAYIEDRQVVMLTARKEWTNGEPGAFIEWAPLR